MLSCSLLTRGIDGLGDDAVHAGERADVHDAVGALVVEVDGPAGGEHHLAQGALAGQVGTAVLEDLGDVRVRWCSKTSRKSSIRAFSSLLHHPGGEEVLEPVLAQPALLLAQPAEGLVVGVPHPLAHAGQPAFAALGLDVADQLVVGEGVEPAEDLAHHADERAGPPACTGMARKAFFDPAAGRP